MKTHPLEIHDVTRSAVDCVRMCTEKSLHKQSISNVSSVVKVPGGPESAAIKAHFRSPSSQRTQTFVTSFKLSPQSLSFAARERGAPGCVSVSLSSRSDGWFPASLYPSLGGAVGGGVDSSSQKNPS